MSLVVLRSWSDGPPKIRAIAPPDSDDFVYVPDHKGQFVAQEISKKSQKVVTGTVRGDIDANEDHDDDGPNSCVEEGEDNDNGLDSRRDSNCSSNGNGYGSGNKNVIVKGEQWKGARKSQNHSNQEDNGSQNNSIAISGDKPRDERYSATNVVTLHLQQRQQLRPTTSSQSQSQSQSQNQKNRFNEGRIPHTKLDRVVLRSTSTSPDQDLFQESSTPPSSPLSGRYRNLGPELAACIPKRQLKFGTNWMKDDPSNIGIKWSHRRNLSNSTPSLSQDFYSSEEEKISSYSSQSSSKTPSPQPPLSSTSSSPYYLESPSQPQQTHSYSHNPRQHPARQQNQHHHHHTFQFQPNNQSVVERETEDYHKGRTTTIDQVLAEEYEQETQTPATLQSSTFLLTVDGERSGKGPSPSHKFQQRKHIQLDGRQSQSPSPSSSSSSQLRGNRRIRQRQLLSSPSTPPPPPPDQHDFYRFAQPATITTSTSLGSLKCAGKDQNLDASYVSNLRKQSSLSSEDEHVSSGQDSAVSLTSPHRSFEPKSDVILVEVIRKQLRLSSTTSPSDGSSSTPSTHDQSQRHSHVQLELSSPGIPANCETNVSRHAANLNATSSTSSTSNSGSENISGPYRQSSLSIETLTTTKTKTNQNQNDEEANITLGANALGDESENQKESASNTNLNVKSIITSNSGSEEFNSGFELECKEADDKEKDNGNDKINESKNQVTVPHVDVVNKTDNCSPNEKLCAVQQIEKKYLTSASTPQQIEQGNNLLIKTTTTTTTSTTNARAELEESFEEIIVDEVLPVAATVTTTTEKAIIPSNSNSKTREIVNIVEKEPTETTRTRVSSSSPSISHTSTNFQVESDQPQPQPQSHEKNTCTLDWDQNHKQVAGASQCEPNNEKKRQEEEETKAGNPKELLPPPLPPVHIAPGSSAQYTDTHPSNSNSKPQFEFEGPHCLTTSYLNLDLVECKENESERTAIAIAICHSQSGCGSIDRTHQDQKHSNPQRANSQAKTEDVHCPVSSVSSVLKATETPDHCERNQDQDTTTWSHFILNCDDPCQVKSSHENLHAGHSHQTVSAQGNNTCSEPIICSISNSAVTNTTTKTTEVLQPVINQQDPNTSSGISVEVTNVKKYSEKVLEFKIVENQSQNQALVPLTQVEQDKSNQDKDKAQDKEGEKCKIKLDIHNQHQEQEQRSSRANSDTDTRSLHVEHKSQAQAQLKLKAQEPSIMERGKNLEGPSPIASVKIPVQAVNKHVRSDLGDENDADVIWRNSAVSESLRGFCQELLESSSNGSSQDISSNSNNATESYNEKIIIYVPQPQSQPQSLLPSQGMNEGVIEFEDDDGDDGDADDRCSSDLSSSDASDNHPIQQCNNSIEYISVLHNIEVNGTVNRKECNVGKKGKNSNEDHFNVPPKPIKWIITLDLGSRASGFSYWYQGEPNVVHIGSWPGDNCFHKIPSWVLTSNDGSVSKMPVSSEKMSAAVNSFSVKVGQEALDEYTEKQGQSSSLTFVSQWREFFELDSDAAHMLTYPYTMDTVDDMNFSNIVTALIHFFGQAALSQISAKFGSLFDKGEPIEWLITIPTCWNSQSRQCMREAAYKSGAIKANDGVNLIEDPMASSFFAAMCGEYNSFLAVDAGGSFLHYSGFELQQGNMHQTVEARSLSLPTPERTFENILTQIVSQEFILYYKAKYRPGWIELMKNFEKAKCKFDNNGFVPHSSAFIFLPSSFVMEFHCYTGMEISECINEQNTGIMWNDNGALCMPQSEMKLILQSTLDFVVNRIDSVLNKHVFENIILTGGLARCKFLKESISQRFPELKLIMPKEYPNGVLQGATLSLMPNIQPKLVIKSPFSIGVGVMTPFDTELHPEEKKIVKDGKAWCADVWDTLIKFGQEIVLNSVINKRSYVGAQPGQSCLVLPLFKSCHSSVPKLVTDKSVLKCCELRFESTKTWQEIDLILTCRASELIVMAVDRENVVHRVVIDFM